MAIDRTTIVRGPGAVQFAGAVLHDASGITAEVQIPTLDIPSSVAGVIDAIKTDQTGSVAITPCGEISSTIIAALFPHQSPVIGASCMGATDVPLVIHSRAGRKITFAAACLAAIPELILSPVATAFGAARFACVVGKGDAPEDDALWTEEAAAYAIADPSGSGIAGRQYAASWAGLSIPDTASGWRVGFELRLEPVVADSVGTVDYTLAGLTVRASCQPLGLSESQILTALKGHAARGSSMASANDLTLSAAGGLTVVLRNAGLYTGPLAWGASTLRAGELGFVAHRNAAGSLYSVALTPEA